MWSWVNLERLEAKKERDDMLLFLECFFCFFCMIFEITSVCLEIYLSTHTRIYIYNTVETGVFTQTLGLGNHRSPPVSTCPMHLKSDVSAMFFSQLAVLDYFD